MIHAGEQATMSQNGKILRVMTPDGEKPRIGSTARTLGVRCPQDVALDERGWAVPGKGMSVAPTLTELPHHRIPRRLRKLVPSATGCDDDRCFRLAELSYRPGVVADALSLRPDLLPRPDGRRHGQIEPTQPMPVSRFSAALGDTQARWVLDEEAP
jgi:hypothetical protein